MNPLPLIDYDDMAGFKAFVESQKAVNCASRKPHPGALDTKETVLGYQTTDGNRNRAIIYQTSGSSTNKCPLIIVYHGGGFCIGAPEEEEQMCTNYVLAFNAVCVSVGYRLAPEFPFLYAFQDSWDALQWAARNAMLWGADPSVGFIISGTLAGGNIATILAHLARDEGLSPSLTGQHLLIPMVLPPEVVPEKYRPHYLSHEQNRFAPLLPVSAIDMFVRSYKPDINDAVRYAIFNHPNGHAHLPSTVLQISGMDPLRDEGLLYEKVLREDWGIKTKLYIYPGQPHGHFGVFPFLKNSEKFRQDQVNGMG